MQKISLSLWGLLPRLLVEVIDYQMKQGKKIGMISVHLYRPFSEKHLLATLFQRLWSVLQCSTERKNLVQKANHCTLMLRVHSTMLKTNLWLLVAVTVSVHLIPTSSHYLCIQQSWTAEPKNHFTVGIVDDVTFTSLPLIDEIPMGGWRYVWG